MSVDQQIVAEPRQTSGNAFKRMAACYIAPATSSSTGLRLVFDIEADALPPSATTIHCIVVADLDSEQIDEYGPQQIEAGLEHLARADYLAGHNICSYDLPLLRRLHDWAPASSCTIVDTLIAGRLILPSISDLDDQAVGMGAPKLGKLRGRYSLEAWGLRLGIPKTGTDIEDWSRWTQEMQERCVGDVVLCKALWHFLKPDGCNPQALTLEHQVAAICERISADGVPFDTAAAARLSEQWTTRRAELKTKLLQQFPGTNLNSRPQIGALLEARGWVPENRTERTNQPEINDEVLETITEMYPEFNGLAEYMLLGRRLAQLTDGDKAWCKNIGPDGRIHGGIIHIGTPHSRAAHFGPNLAQVPNPKKGKPFGAECRALFRDSGGWVFVTCDQASLQDRGYAHYLHGFDGGAYARAFLEGIDTHWQSAITLGLISAGAARDKNSKLHTALREGAKTFRYAFLYGCGQMRAGRIIAATVHAAQQIDTNSDLAQQFFGKSAHPNEAALKRIGKQALDRFEAGTPGLRRLRQYLRTFAQRYGWLPGLDRRRVPVRALYSVLNFIVASSEAIICKRWLVRVHDELCARSATAGMATWSSCCGCMTN
jgi:DNA polymerase I-like protein with 3'-5' exonuclease and polymerase domains